VEDDVDDGFSGKAAAQIVGITYRQLDYWARTDLVRPTLADAKGSGSRRKYSYRDLLELKLIKTMLDSGIKLESVRDAFSYLRTNLGEDVASARLVIAGSSAVLVRDDAEMIEVVNGLHGQGVLNLNLVTLDGLKGELDAAVHDLRPVEVEVAPADAPRDADAPQAHSAAGT
jgi:DNA-binding transcriptional MerR regulator